MKRTLSLPDLADRVITNRPASPLGQDNSTASAEKPVGLVHLLENHTLDQILGFDCIDGEGTDFVCNGRLPDERSFRNDVADWILTFDEPKLHLALLKLGNIDIRISTEEDVRRLLNAVNLEPATHFSKLTLDLTFTEKEVVETMLCPLIKLIRTNNIFDEIRLDWCESEWCDLGSLFDTLSDIRNLKLSTSYYSDDMPVDNLQHLVKLLTKNKTVQTLDLKALPAIDCSSTSHDVFLELLRQLKEQTVLEVFRVAVATARSQELIGEFVENSHSIQRLSIDMHGSASPPSLIRGLKKNTSLKMLGLNVDSITQRGRAASCSVLPLISLLEKNKCPATELILDISRCSPDEISSLFQVEDEFNENRTVIENLLASNTTLDSLTLIFSRAVSVDLFPIAKGLSKNRSLESLHIRFWDFSESVPSPKSCIDRSTLPAFLEVVAKNETLVNMTFEDIDPGGGSFFNDDELTRILFRNANFRKYACSFGYLNGAVAGFLGMMEIPYDLSTKLSEYLADERPVAVTKALASVNKATSNTARLMRRFEAAHQLEQMLDASQTDLQAASNGMVSLLARIATTKQDFSDDDLRKIGKSDLLKPGLIYWLRENPSIFNYLASRFDEAAGIKISRKQIIREFDTEHWDESYRDEDRLRLIEEIFKPDQQHLAFLMGQKLDYQSIGSSVLRRFVGYELLSPEPETGHVLNWCIINQQPELYLAYMENYPEEWLSTEELFPEFRQRFLSGMALSQKVRRLNIADYDEESDAGIVEALLSNGSGLQYLHLSNAIASSSTFNPMMKKLAANRGLKELEISFCKKGKAFPVFERVRETLLANRVLERLILEVPSNHVEFALLKQLADTHGRFELDTGNFNEASEDSEDL